MAEGITERYGARPYGFQFITEGAFGFVIDKSGIYFINAKLETYDEVEERGALDEEILRSNMRGNNYPIIVTNYGKAKNYRFSIPFNRADALVDEAGVVVVTGQDPIYSMYAQLQILEFKAYWEDKYPAIFADGRKPRTVTTKGVPA